MHFLGCFCRIFGCYLVVICFLDLQYIGAILGLNIFVSDRAFNTREIETWILSLSAALGMSTSSWLLISPGSCVARRDVGTHTLSFEFYTNLCNFVASGER